MEVNRRCVAATAKHDREQQRTNSNHPMLIATVLSTASKNRNRGWWNDCNPDDSVTLWIHDNPLNRLGTSRSVHGPPSFDLFSKRNRSPASRELLIEEYIIEELKVWLLVVIAAGPSAHSSFQILTRHHTIERKNDVCRMGIWVKHMDVLINVPIQLLSVTKLFYSPKNMCDRQIAFINWV